MKKRTTLSPAFEILVANFTGDFDSEGNPIKSRTKFREQLVYGRGKLNRMGLLEDQINTANATATHTVSDNDFTTGDAIVEIDGYEIINGVHYAVGGSTALTATNLGAVINALDGFSASVGGSDITITGPTGPDGGFLPFKVIYLGSITNFTLSPTTGFFTPGGPLVGAPEAT